MKTYYIETEIIRAKGIQYWSVEAESEKEALIKFSDGEADFESEEIDVTSIGLPRITQ